MFQKCALFLVTLSSLVALASCGGSYQRDIEIAEQFPAIESSRILVTIDDVPKQTYKQEHDSVFSDFQYQGDLFGDYSSGKSETHIANTPYSISYVDLSLRVFREGEMIAERRLPKLFQWYPKPISSAVIIGKSPAEDRILCRTKSRAAAGLHYVLIADGNGEILFEKVMRSGDDWDILPGKSGEIIIGGAWSTTTISDR